MVYSQLILCSQSSLRSEWPLLGASGAVIYQGRATILVSDLHSKHTSISFFYDSWPAIGGLSRHRCLDLYVKWMPWPGTCFRHLSSTWRMYASVAQVHWRQPAGSSFVAGVSQCLPIKFYQSQMNPGLVVQLEYQLARSEYIQPVYFLHLHPEAFQHFIYARLKW